MDYQKETLQILRDHGATVKDQHAGRMHWARNGDLIRLSGGQPFTTSIPGRAVDPRAWRNNYVAIKKIFGVKAHSVSGKTKSSKKKKRTQSSSPSSSPLPAAELTGRTFQQKLVTAVGVDNIPALYDIKLTFTPKRLILSGTTEAGVTSPLPVPPLPVVHRQKEVAVPRWYRPRPDVTPAMRTATFDKWDRAKLTWTPDEITFGDRVFYLCGPVDFNLFVAELRRSKTNPTEECVMDTKGTEQQIASIRQAIAERQELIAEAEKAKEELKLLEETETSLKMTLESLTKTASLISSTHGFTIGKRTPAKTTARRSSPAGGKSNSYIAKIGEIAKEKIAQGHPPEFSNEELAAFARAEGFSHVDAKKFDAAYYQANKVGRSPFSRARTGVFILTRTNGHTHAGAD